MSPKVSTKSHPLGMSTRSHPFWKIVSTRFHCPRNVSIPSLNILGHRTDTWFIQILFLSLGEQEMIITIWGRVLLCSFFDHLVGTGIAPVLTKTAVKSFHCFVKQDWNQCLCNFFSFSLLVFAQKRSNHILAILMALSFYFQVILSCLVFTVGPWDFMTKYWIGTAHPLLRLPVFFMGVCAGVLCIRIQQGDLDAFHSKLIF